MLTATVQNATCVLHTVRQSRPLDRTVVDNFVSDDALQCEIVAALSLAGDDGPGLFLVGDPKQSIFAWRNADLAAFDAFAERMTEAGGSRLTPARKRVLDVLRDGVPRKGAELAKVSGSSSAVIRVGSPGSHSWADSVSMHLAKFVTNHSSHQTPAVCP